MTVATVATLAPEPGLATWFDTHTPGLALTITPAGAKTWYLIYRHGRQMRRLKLGRYETKYRGLGWARAEARDHRKAITTTGADPVAERKAERAAPTVGEVWLDYLEAYAKVEKATWDQDVFRYNRYLKTPWGARPIAEITKTDALQILDKIVRAGHRVQATRTQYLISAIWKFAYERELVEKNIVYNLKKRGGREFARAVVLDDLQIRGLLDALAASSNDAAQAVLLRLLTGQRGGEIHAMRWDEINWRESAWTIPAPKTKNRQRHRIPLVGAARELLEARFAARDPKDARVFPGLAHRTRPMRRLNTIHAGAYRWHDLRRTVGTRLAKLGVSRDTRARLLNHTKVGVTDLVYNDYEYDAEKIAALTLWQKEIYRILVETPSLNAPTTAAIDRAPGRSPAEILFGLSTPAHQLASTTVQ